MHELEPFVIHRQSCLVEQKRADHIITTVQWKIRERQHGAPRTVGLLHRVSAIFVGSQRGDSDAFGLLNHESDVGTLCTTPTGLDGYHQILALKYRGLSILRLRQIRHIHSQNARSATIYSSHWRSGGRRLCSRLRIGQWQSSAVERNSA